MIRIGRTKISYMWAPGQWGRKAGHFGPTRLGDGKIEAFWLGPLGMLLLTDAATGEAGR